MRKVNTPEGLLSTRNYICESKIKSAWSLFSLYWYNCSTPHGRL